VDTAHPLFCASPCNARLVLTSLIWQQGQVCNAGLFGALIARVSARTVDETDDEGSVAGDTFTASAIFFFTANLKMYFEFELIVRSDYASVLLLIIANNKITDNKNNIVIQNYKDSIQDQLFILLIFILLLLFVIYIIR